MGFTRYWKINKQLDTEKFKDYSETCRMVCQAWEQEQISKGDNSSGLAGWDGYGEPVFRGSDICFNGCVGDEDLSHETFSIGILSNMKTGCNFCKTARKPYDKQVVACLYLLEKFFGDDVGVGSDGDNSDSEIISFLKSYLRDNKLEILIKE